MIKILLILSSAMLIATAFFGALNHQTFIAESDKTAEANKKWKAANEELVQVEATLEERKDELNDAKNAGAKLDAELTQAKEKLLQKGRSVKELEETLKEEVLKFEKFEVVLEEFKDDKGEIPSIEKLRDKQETMSKAVVDTKAEAEGTRGKTVEANKFVVVGEAQIQGRIEKQKERASSFIRNGFEATITAVNRDWGFVIIDAGRDKGVKADSSLLVSRADGTRVGKVNIISIEPAVTVADIDQDSLTGGAKIQPGYKVIYEEVAQ